MSFKIVRAAATGIMLILFTLIAFAASSNKQTDTKENKTKQTAPITGACTKSDREKVINRTNTRFAEKWDSCGRSVSGNTEGTVQCMKEAYPALSNACANCIGQMTACSRTNCSWQCAGDSHSPKCQECTQKHCIPALMKCTGIAPQDFPQFRSR